MSEALLKAMLIRRRDRRAGAGVQAEFDFGGLPEAARIEATWRDASEREKANRTLFAQRSLKPEDVLPNGAGPSTSSATAARPPASSNARSAGSASRS